MVRITFSTLRPQGHFLYFYNERTNKQTNNNDEKDSRFTALQSNDRDHSPCSLSYLFPDPTSVFHSAMLPKLSDPRAPRSRKLRVPESSRFPEALGPQKLRVPRSSKYPEAPSTRKLQVPESFRFPKAPGSRRRI